MEQRQGAVLCELNACCLLLFVTLIISGPFQTGKVCGVKLESVKRPLDIETTFEGQLDVLH